MKQICSYHIKFVQEIIAIYGATKYMRFPFEVHTLKLYVKVHYFEPRNAIHYFEMLFHFVTNHCCCCIEMVIQNLLISFHQKALKNIEFGDRSVGY